METKANYKGFILNANRKINGKVLIWGTDVKLKSLDFIEDLSVNPITYDKIVEKNELNEFYREHEFGTYKGIEFCIIDETSDTYTLSYTYENYKVQEKEIRLCESLGFKEIDRTVFEKKVPKSEVTNYRIEKEDLLHK